METTTQSAVRVINEHARVDGDNETSVVRALKKAKKTMTLAREVRSRVDVDVSERGADGSLAIVRDACEHLRVGIRDNVECAVKAIEVHVRGKELEDD